MRLSVLNLLLLDIRTNGKAFYSVRIIKVVFQVEFVDVERDDKLGEIGRKVGCPHQGKGEIGPCDWGVRLAGEGRKEGATYKKTCLVPSFIVAVGSWFVGLVIWWGCLAAQD